MRTFVSIVKKEGVKDAVRLLMRLERVLHSHPSWATKVAGISKRDLNHSVMHAEHGKPVLTPCRGSEAARSMQW